MCPRIIRATHKYIKACPLNVGQLKLPQAVPVTHGLIGVRRESRAGKTGRYDISSQKMCLYSFFF